MMCVSPIVIYFVYFHSVSILRDLSHYTPHQVLVHSLWVGILAELLGYSVLRTHLTTIFHPLKILRLSWIVLCILSLLMPWYMHHITAVWHLFLIQALLLLFKVNDFPAVPIFYRSFPVFKRFTAASLLFAMATAVTYAATSFGLTYLIDYFNYWGFWVLITPALIDYGYGLHYFIKQERKTARYPVLKMWEFNRAY
jgi:MFS transporter, MHS family, proline/betaine transporter